MPVPEKKPLSDLYNVHHSSNAASANVFYYYWNGGIPETIAATTEDVLVSKADSVATELKNSTKK
jgi:hypothetical protein